MDQIENDVMTEEMTVLVDGTRNGETLLSATDIIGDENGAGKGEINLYYRLFKLQILYNENIFSIPDPALGAEYSNYNY